MASNDPRVHFGLGKIDKIDSIEVIWPSGSPRREQFEVKGVDQSIEIRQGGGKAVK